MIGLIGLPPLNNDSNGGSVLVLVRRVHPPSSRNVRPQSWPRL